MSSRISHACVDGPILVSVYWWMGNPTRLFFLSTNPCFPSFLSIFPFFFSSFSVAVFISEEACIGCTQVRMNGGLAVRSRLNTSEHPCPCPGCFAPAQSHKCPRRPHSFYHSFNTYLLTCLLNHSLTCPLSDLLPHYHRPTQMRTQCVLACPESFAMLENGKARTYKQRSAVQVNTAIATCPVDCMHKVSYEELKKLETARDHGVEAVLGSTGGSAATATARRHRKLDMYHYLQTKCYSEFMLNDEGRTDGRIGKPNWCFSFILPLLLCNTLKHASFSYLSFPLSIQCQSSVPKSVVTNAPCTGILAKTPTSSDARKSPTTYAQRVSRIEASPTGIANMQISKL